MKTLFIATLMALFACTPRGPLTPMERMRATRTQLLVTIKIPIGLGYARPNMGELIMGYHALDRAAALTNPEVVCQTPSRRNEIRCEISIIGNVDRVQVSVPWTTDPDWSLGFRCPAITITHAEDSHATTFLRLEQRQGPVCVYRVVDARP